MSPRFLTAAAALCTASFSAFHAFAGVEMDAKKTMVTPATEVPLTTVRISSSYTAESDFHRGHDASGDAWWNSIEVGHRFPLNISLLSAPDSGWYFRAGGAYDRFDFDNSGNLPLPNHLQSFNAVLAVEYLRHGQTGILIETRPGFYFEDDVRGKAFDIPTTFAFAIPITESFAIAVGVNYTGLRADYPLAPVGGVYWKINEHWTLRAIVPEPRLIYDVTNKLAVFVGGELVGESFRVENDPSRPERLRNAALHYTETHVGAGLTYGSPDRCSVEFGAGYAFNRKFEFERADETYNTDGAPYVKLVLHAGF